MRTDPLAAYLAQRNALLAERDRLRDRLLAVETALAPTSPKPSGSASARILAWLHEHPGSTTREVRAAFPDLGEVALHRALSGLFEGGRVAREKRDGRSVYSFRDAAPPRVGRWNEIRAHLRAHPDATVATMAVAFASSKRAIRDSVQKLVQRNRVRRDPITKRYEVLA